MEQRHGLVFIVSIVVVALAIIIGMSLTPPPRLMTAREVADAVAGAPASCRAQLRQTLGGIKGGVYDLQYKQIYKRDCPPLTAYGVSSNGGFVVVHIPRQQ